MPALVAGIHGFFAGRYCRWKTDARNKSGHDMGVLNGTRANPFDREVSRLLCVKSDATRSS